MAVYLMQAGLSGPVKIGKADNAAKRMFSFQTVHYEVLHLLRVWEGGRKEEAALHARFKHLWIRGEWFTFCPAMLDDVGLTRIAHSPAYEANPAVTPARGIVEVIERLGGAVAVGKITGTTPNTVHYWARRGSVPAKYWAALAQHAEAVSAHGFDMNALMRNCSAKNVSTPRLRLVPNTTFPDLFNLADTFRIAPASDSSASVMQVESV